MKTLGYIAIFLFFLAASGYCEIADRVKDARDRRRAGSSLDVVAMLDAIAAVESGNNPHAVGALGERGRCQFMPGTWALYTREPFLAWAPIDCDVTRNIERRHLSWICGQLAKEGIAIEPVFIAAAWRHGPGNAARCCRTDYARRVANLYEDFTKDKR